MMPPDRPRLPAHRTDAIEDAGLTDDERKFLRDFARNGIASRRVWKLIVFACGGIAAVAGAVAAVIGLAHVISSPH